MMLRGLDDSFTSPGKFQGVDIRPEKEDDSTTWKGISTFLGEVFKIIFNYLCELEIRDRFNLVFKYFNLPKSLSSKNL